VRAEDVPLFVSKLKERNIDAIGLTGEDLFFEYNSQNNNLEVISKINWFDENALFKKPAICVLSKKELEQLNGSTIAINKKYQNISNSFLVDYTPKEIIYFNGCTETASILGIADFVIDIVYSGKSAKESGLKIKKKLFESNVVVIK
jgi:ATP phosphoribosyltransferase